MTPDENHSAWVEPDRMGGGWRARCLCGWSALQAGEWAARSTSVAEYCYQCGDEITADRFGKWTHTHGHPRNGHLAMPERSYDEAADMALAHKEASDLRRKGET